MTLTRQWQNIVCGTLYATHHPTAAGSLDSIARRVHFTITIHGSNTMVLCSLYVLVRVAAPQRVQHTRTSISANLNNGFPPNLTE